MNRLPVSVLTAFALVVPVSSTAVASTPQVAAPSAAGSQRVVSGDRLGASRLVVDGAPRVRSFLRFGRLQRTGGRVTLELWVLDGRPGTQINVRLVPSSALSGALRRRRLPWHIVARAKIGPVPGRVRVDVSPVVAGGKSPVLLLSTSARRAVVFAGRGAAHAPRLRLGVPLPAGGIGGTPGAAPAGDPVAGGSSAATGGAPPPALPALPAPPRVPPIPSLPAASRFVSVSGSDATTCTRAAPCRTFDRAYKVAAPGEVVEIASGAYGEQTITRDPSKTGAGCASDGKLAACVVFRAAAGGSVTVGDLSLGPGGRTDGPAGVMVVADGNSRFTTSYTNIGQSHESVLSGISSGNLYVAGSTDTTITGGEVGPMLSTDGTHPEVQRVYGSDPLIVPENLTIQGVWFHDINTTNRTAHVDCLQIENGTNVVVRGNRFDRCGSVGLRMSYGSDTRSGPPTNVLIENNAFGFCAAIPVSPCYYAAQLGVGRNVLVRNNSAAQELQPTGAAGDGTDIRYVGNVAKGVSCESFVTYSHNVFSAAKCGPTDRKVTSLGFVDPGAADMHLSPGSPAIDAGDPLSFPTIDIEGAARPQGAAPDAGAYES